MADPPETLPAPPAPPNALRALGDAPAATPKPEVPRRMGRRELPSLHPKTLAAATAEFLRVTTGREFATARKDLLALARNPKHRADGRTLDLLAQYALYHPEVGLREGVADWALKNESRLGGGR